MYHPTDKIIHITAFVTPIVPALVGMGNNRMLGLLRRFDSAIKAHQASVLMTKLNSIPGKKETVT